jgi:hypothetical protein
MAEEILLANQKEVFNAGFRKYTTQVLPVLTPNL